LLDQEGFTREMPLDGAAYPTSVGNLKIGARVAGVRTHWVRAGQTGTVATTDKAINRWLVEFRETSEGGGIDGNKLWLNEAQFRVQENEC
jgi:hypothetical protein